ncbi:hypothetical protein FEM48_Zijuj01G0325000 [Ziziphus jujuba var. spinosa]|uniref:Sas10 C-terminal domain-containing protein n=1 Tax=Ziziphus jujuba var. spinosa TaxID=714518 RepID=A0A978W6J7_ZIZJJ|nr:hypothetical protein FEM48_Zijuj01G0325000 [Ziziphus jujuba var. spinosa]
MGKRGKSQSKGNGYSKRKRVDEGKSAFDEDMDDEIDAFHKQRDLVPLDVNEDEKEESDEDMEQPVFNFEVFPFRLVARQQKYMRAKFGGVEDELLDDNDEEGEKEEQKRVWGGRKHLYYDADNRDYELQSSDDESAAEEEEEVIRLQKEHAKSLSMEDFGLEDASEDESDKELTMEEILVKGKSKKQSPMEKDVADEMAPVYEQVKKDLNTLPREKVMDVLFSSAPEIVGLLSDLNDATEQLERKVNPLLNKVKKGEIMVEGGIRYLELYQPLLLLYCQAITFYLLLKSELKDVRDHPVVARLVEIKSLLDKMRQLDGNLPMELEEILNKSNVVETVMKDGKENAISACVSFADDHGPSHVSAGTQEDNVIHNSADVVKVELMKDNEKKTEKIIHQNDKVGAQSMKMLKVRAALEEKLKQKGLLGSITPKTEKAKKIMKPLNRELETYDDFDDDAVNIEGANRGLSNGHASFLSSSKLSHLIAAKPEKLKVVSGDDDLPKKDDIGERRRKHELQVLARAGVESEDGAGYDIEDAAESDGDVEMDEDNETEDSEDEFYKQAKQQRAAKLAAKAEIHSRNPPVPSLPETVDGKRLITYQMEKNRGLTRARKKLTKNPRKKYKLKHQKAVERRKGQVRQVKKPTTHYGGETTGINAGISRSIRFKN